MYCPKCRNTIPDGSSFCNVCGCTIQPSPAGQAPYSANNGSPMSYGANPQEQPSSNPGYHTGPYGESANPYATSPDPRGASYNPYGTSYDPYGAPVMTRKKSKTGLIAIIACLIVAISVGAWFLLKDDSSSEYVNMGTAQSSPENVLKAFVAAYNNRDAQTLVSLIADAANADDDAKNEYIENAKKSFEFLNDDLKMEIEIKSVENVDDDTAKIKYDITIGNMGTTESEDTCVKIDGKWYVKAVI